ncbi:hypothetical protein ATZ33_01090 [Enterococcus silesiacus]|uniref:WxL domain-containing protein n=1 Tax=Enterococcus silesiacus TaxID=332949 RepID=A0A0S3K7F2_9ENTE|nr:hypothetical protein [Enterococcus silesiacus]ALS00025.1 hypothetical protein ATZ33_01090 [Enterococcus silesiacus]OJG86751.1 hypothetical protein RV15_GL002349 [Enterococcus silesiacus]
MNKKVLGTLVLGLSIGAVLLPQAAQAADREANTGVGIGFSNDDPNTIIPGPYDEALSLINKPTAFKFGTENEASALSSVYYQQVAGKQYIAVYEDRDDKDQTNWKLNAKLSPLVSTTDATKKLEATMTMNSANISTFSLDDQRDAETGKLPNTIEALPALTKYTEEKVKGVTKVTLKAGENGSSDILVGTKPGKKGFASEIRNVQLAVTAGQKEETNGKQFTGTVSWSLEDTI